MELGPYNNLAKLGKYPIFFIKNLSTQVAGGVGRKETRDKGDGRQGHKEMGGRNTGDRETGDRETDRKQGNKRQGHEMVEGRHGLGEMGDRETACR